MREKSNIKLSTVLSVLFHLLLALIFWGMRPEDIGTIKKAETERIETRLVELVRKTSKQQESKSPKKSSKSKSGKIKWDGGVTQVEFSDNLPSISSPRLAVSDYQSESKTAFSDSTENELEIKKVSGSKGSKTSKEIKISSDRANLTDSAFNDDMVMDDINKDFNESDYMLASGEDDSLKKAGLPGGIAVNVSGGGKAYWLKEPDQEYPEEAEKNSWQGTVKVKITVDPSGNVVRVFIIEKSGFPVLDNAALSQARRWKIAIVKNKLPVRGTAIVTVPFKFSR